MPTVSVIIPTYDREALLREAVASVRAQTYEDWELIVADDGSTDGTRAYLAAIDDARVRPLLLEHRGDTISARQAALDVARGRWIAFLDSDDAWLPDKLSRQLACLAEHSRCRWSYTGYHLVDVAGAPLPPRDPAADRAPSGWILAPLLTFAASASIVTLLVERALLAEIGGFDPAFPIRGDYELVLRLAAHGEACALAESLAAIRVHDGRTTGRLRVAEMFAENAAVFAKAARWAPTAELRAVCRRQRGLQLAERARALAREGAVGASLAALVEATHAAPFVPGVWRAWVGAPLALLGRGR
jgi:glycosyltransferase involved in cell wall biosynthesis